MQKASKYLTCLSHHFRDSKKGIGNRRQERYRLGKKAIIYEQRNKDHISSIHPASKGKIFKLDKQSFHHGLSE